MLILSLTTDKLQVVTAGAATVNVVASFTDRNQSTGVIGLSDRQVTAITTGTTTDVVAAPAATTTRNVQTIQIRNSHATAQVEVTLQFNANATIFEFYSARLYPGDCLEYSDGVGFSVIVATPAIDIWVQNIDVDQGTSQTVASFLWFRINGLMVRVLDNITYNWEFFNLGSSGVATTGYNVWVGSYGPASDNGLAAGIHTVTTGVAAAVLSAGSSIQPFNGNPIIAQTTGDTVNNPAYYSGTNLIGAGSGGPDDHYNLVVGILAEVAATIQARTGSWFHVWQAKG